jgi:hypothetical protein
VNRIVLNDNITRLLESVDPPGGLFEHIPHDDHIAIGLLELPSLAYSYISFGLDLFQHSLLNPIVSDGDPIELRDEVLARISRLCVLVKFRSFLRSLSNELKAWSHRLGVVLEAFAEAVILST